MSKKLNEMDSHNELEIGISTDDASNPNNRQELDRLVNTGLDIGLKDMDETVIDETLKTSIGDILKAFGISGRELSPEALKDIKAIIKQTSDLLNKKGYSNIILKEDDEELRGLYGDEERDERAEEYGVKTEDFDSIMETLNKNNNPKIKIDEHIRPRIKKSDLIKYLKK